MKGLIGCYTSDLMESLSTLAPTDFLAKNEITRNLTIYRNDINIGMVDLLGGEIIFWDDGEE